MSKYEEIGNAFGRFCDAAWKIRDEVEGVARRLAYAVSELGEIPTGKFGFAPALDDFEKGETYDVRTATNFEAEKRRWAVHYYIEVSRGADLWPIRILIFVIYVTPDSRGLLLKLGSRKPEVEKLLEPRETESGIKEFAGAILNEILKYFDELAANPIPPPEENETRISGFGS